MDVTEDSRENRPIEDYLFGGRSSKSTFDSDQLFPKPIEDEDLFGMEEFAQSGPTGDEPIIEQVIEATDDIDWEDSSPFIAMRPNNRNKMAEVKEKLRQQAKALNLKPKPLGTGADAEGNIEILIEGSKLVSDSSSKLTFSKLFNKRAKGATPEKRQAHVDSLRKRISAEKRKIWDSFQAPICYDEEELEEESRQEEDGEEDEGQDDGEYDGENAGEDVEEDENNVEIEYELDHMDEEGEGGEECGDDDPISSSYESDEAEDLQERDESDHDDHSDEESSEREDHFNEDGSEEEIGNELADEEAEVEYEEEDQANNTHRKRIAIIEESDDDG